MSYEEALEAMEKGKYEDVLKWFEGLPAARRDGKAYALAALAHFKLEEYEDAEKLYADAVTAGGTDAADTDAADWGNMQALAKANATAKIDVEVPKPYYFKDDPNLLEPPSVRDGDLPRPLRRRPGHRCFKRLRLFLGDALGVLATAGMDWLIEWVGRKFGYRARVWTDWYRRCWQVGVLILAYIDKHLPAREAGRFPKAGSAPAAWRHPFPHRRRKLE
jgi:tetratricopeptide (TPR) repeat protein